MIGIYILIFLVGGLPLCFFKDLKLSNGMNGVFFGIIISAYFLAFIYRILKDYNFLLLLDEVTKYIKDNKKLLKENPDKLSEKIEGKNKSFSELWFEYQKTLIKSEDGEYHQGIDVDRYFNEESLIYERVNLRFFNYISQSFVALGIIGTFLGLAIGLGSLGDASIFTQSEAMMSDKMTQLLSGVTTSFYTSLYGLYYSVMYSIFLNIYLGNYQTKVSKIKEVLKFTFVGNLMEKSIENMKDGIKRIDDKNNQVYQMIISEFKKNIDEISKINVETIQNLNNEFSEKVKNIHEMIVESNQKTEKQNIESANHLNSQLEKMLETADKRQENLIENNEKISEEMKRNTLEISQIVDKQLNKTLEVFSENHSKFLGEFDKLRETFKESLSNDFSKIFNSEFLNKITIVKEQILKMVDQTEKVVIETNIHYKNSSEKNAETLMLTEKINNRLEDTFNKIYSSDYTDKMNEIKNQLLEISDKNKLEFENYVKEMSKINDQLKNNNENNNKFNEKLKEALETIADKEFIEQIKISKENFIEVNKVSTDVLEKSFTKIGALKETIENMDLHFEKSMVILADGLEIMEEKLINLKSLNHSNEATLQMTQDIQKQIKKMLKNLELEEKR